MLVGLFVCLRPYTVNLNAHKFFSKIEHWPRHFDAESIKIEHWPRHFDAESIGKGNAGLLLPECSVGNRSGDASS